MAKQLKKWQGWLLFGGTMVVVFLLGLLVSSLMERRAEVVSVFNNKRTENHRSEREVQGRLSSRIRDMGHDRRHIFRVEVQQFARG